MPRTIQQGCLPHTQEQGHTLQPTQRYRITKGLSRRSQWSRGLRRGSAAARMLGLPVRFPAGGIDVCGECCVLSGREVSASGWSLVQTNPTNCSVSEFDREDSMRSWPTWGSCAMGRINDPLKIIQINGSFKTLDGLKIIYRFTINDVMSSGTVNRSIKKKLELKPKLSKLYWSCLQTVLKWCQFWKYFQDYYLV